MSSSDLREIMLKVSAEVDTGISEIFYLFGASDVLLLGIGNTCDTLREIQKIGNYQRI